MSYPIIIIGMHRSGTTLLTRHLEGLGLWVGSELEANHESTFFKEYNDWLLTSVGARWEAPAAFVYALEDRAGRKAAAEYLKNKVCSPYAIKYFGFMNYLQYLNRGDIRQPWGWKDPRNTITLPIWLEVFPDARVIHVIRNGIDIAKSLNKRYLKSSKISIEKQNRRPILSMFNKKKGWYGNGARCVTLKGGFQLWEEYIAYAESNLRQLSVPAFEFRYEDYLNEPAKYLGQCAKFIGIEASETLVASVVEDADNGRAYSYSKEEFSESELTLFRGSQAMSRFGYEV